jgi:hypothetical protein
MPEVWRWYHAEGRRQAALRADQLADWRLTIAASFDAKAGKAWQDHLRTLTRAAGD